MEVTDYENDINNIRFQQLLKKTTIRQPVKEISEKTKTDKGQVSKILNNKIPVSDKFLEKFLKAYDFDNLETDNNLKQPKGVPYYDIEFTAGFLEVENNQSISPDSYVSHPFFKGCDYVVRASGQSMAKLICHGDAIGLVKINNWKDFFPFGEIYALVTNDGFRMVKIVTKGETDDAYTLISKPTDSKKDEFPPQQIKKSSILSIFKVQASSHLY
jgi:transcriptional regulator with XRE-family HTH domain